MSLSAKLLSASGGLDKLYVDDVFSSWLRTGTGADATITTGIDMTKGYMLWSKGRSGATDHAIYDSARGATYDLASNLITAQTIQAAGLKGVSTSGHTVGSLSKMNTSGATYVDFVIRRAPKFFDVVTYMGNGSTQNITHSLGQTPGMIIVKQASGSGGGWSVWHRSLAFGNWMYLNTTLEQQGPAVTLFGNNTINVDPTSSVFTIGSATNCNTTGQTYVAYLFAHDPSADGIVQCGSFTTSASNTFTTTLGWEPQYVLFKSSNSADDWRIVDSFRGFTAGANQQLLSANTSAVEATNSLFALTATGFAAPVGVSNLPASTPYIYLAIRRPNKPPTVGTQVYNAIAKTGTGAAATVTGVGFAPDVCWQATRNSPQEVGRYDRLRGANRGLRFNADPETISTDALNSFTMDGCVLGVAVSPQNAGNTAGMDYINHFFKRAPGVFDVVCYTGTGVARTVPHSLGVAPELMIVKCRTPNWSWYVYGQSVGNTKYLVLNSSTTPSTLAMWNNTNPTASVFSLGTTTGVNGNTEAHVAYLFATKSGISKVGSYTGNGTSQTIDCGFTTGARFVMIKRTDSTGDWYVWDTVRGVVAGNDPHLSLNTTTTEVTTDDSLDPASVGFIVNQLAATNINVTSATYIYLAFA